jgi:hypothetical protein
MGVAGVGQGSGWPPPKNQKKKNPKKKKKKITPAGQSGVKAVIF